jgi:hypothetical protein
MAEDTQLFAEVVFPLAMVFLDARHLPIRTWGLCTRGEGSRDRQWRRRRRERTGKTVQIPTISLYTFSVKERGLRRGERSGSGSPLTDSISYTLVSDSNTQLIDWIKHVASL